MLRWLSVKTPPQFNTLLTGVVPETNFKTFLVAEEVEAVELCRLGFTDEQITPPPRVFPPPPPAPTRFDDSTRPSQVRRREETDVPSTIREESTSTGVGSIPQMDDHEQQHQHTQQQYRGPHVNTRSAPVGDDEVHPNHIPH